VSGGSVQHIAYYYAFSALKWRVDYSTTTTYLQRSDLGQYYQYFPSQLPAQCENMANTASLADPWAWLAQATYSGACTSNGVDGSLWTYSFVSNMHPGQYSLCEANNKPLVYSFNTYSLGEQSVGTQTYNVFEYGTLDEAYFEVPSYCN